MSAASMIVDSDARFTVEFGVGGFATIRTDGLSVILHSRCQLERLALAIDEALHRGECDLEHADIGGEAGGA